MIHGSIIAADAVVVVSAVLVFLQLNSRLVSSTHVKGGLAGS